MSNACQTAASERRIRPILLSGGGAHGFWPLARTDAPAHLQPLFGGRSPLQETAMAVSDRALFDPPTVVADARHRFLAAQQMAEVDAAAGELILEPAGRGALAAAAAATARLCDTAPETFALIAPGDQCVRAADRGAFDRALRAAIDAAADDGLAVFGAPAMPWLERRRSFAALGAANLVDAGWALASVRVLADLFEAAAPELWRAAGDAVRAATTDLDFLRLDPDAYAAIEPVPFDRLLDAAGDRLRPQALAFAPVAARDWADLRAARAEAQDADGNLVDGDAVLLGARNCYVNAGERLTTLAGVDNLAVVVTDDAVLVADASDPNAARLVAERIAQANRPEAHAHPMEHRPWGDFKRLTAGARYQVKRISVKPGGSTSLQLHHHRAEHWVVVAGTAEVTVRASGD